MALPIRAGLRSSYRLAAFVAVLAGALVRFRLFRRHRTPVGRAEWLQDTCRRVATTIGLEIRRTGPPVAPGLLVANHLSYLDVIALGSLHPCAFVAKAEVRSWPLIGWATRAAGTLFVRRESRADLAAATRAIRARLTEGRTVMVFPEGTSSDGAGVLPFHPGVFESVTGTDRLVTPAALRYGISDGIPASDVCYWGDMVFGPHLFRLLGHERITAHVRIGPAWVAVGDRKQLARDARDRVVALALEAAATPFVSVRENVSATTP